MTGEAREARAPAGDRTTPGRGRLQANVKLDGNRGSQPSRYETREQALAGTGEGMLLEEYIG